jgi:dTDP-4-dehydrorhamnose reductase
VLVAIAAQRMPGLLHAGAGEQCSWCEFAAAIVEAGARDCTVWGIPTSEYPTPAPRPAYSVLRSERGAPELPSWRTGLEAFMSEYAEVSA